jgi:PadR family transcriptional regulator, regulatory protein PadR
MATDALRKGTTPMLILALLEVEPRHGYELSRLIESQSRGVVSVHAASLYPLLYEMEQKKWIQGRWVEKQGQRRRRYYRLTRAGRIELEAQRNSWSEFVRAVSHLAGVQHA